MPYRGGWFTQRRQRQRNDVFLYAGQTATLRQWVSATTGVPAAGIGGMDYYAERTVTGIFGGNMQKAAVNDNQAVGGMIAAGEFWVTLREAPTRKDTLIWKGEAYRIESDPVPSTSDGCWQVHVKRAST